MDEDQQDFIEQLKESLDFTFGNTEKRREAVRQLHRAAALITEGVLLHVPAKERAMLLDEDKAMIREAIAAAFCRIHALPHPLHIFVDTNMRKQP